MKLWSTWQDLQNAKANLKNLNAVKSTNFLPIPILDSRILNIGILVAIRAKIDAASMDLLQTDWTPSSDAIKQVNTASVKCPQASGGTAVTDRLSGRLLANRRYLCRRYRLPLRSLRIFQKSTTKSKQLNEGFSENPKNSQRILNDLHKKMNLFWTASWKSLFQESLS